MENTDRLPKLDVAPDYAETIVLTESNVMATRELRQLVDPDASTDEEADDDGC